MGSWFSSPSSSRKYQAQYAKEHGNNGEARHIVPASRLDEYEVGNDHPDNYRMGTKEQNAVDTRIDNMICARQYEPRGLSGGSYIPPERVRSRIEQQVESIKSMDSYSKRYARDLYLAAEYFDMDLRIFNGLKFDRR